jgi:tetratricopeptide (TPR) repeat protein
VRAAGYLLTAGTYPTAQRLLREVERQSDAMEMATRARLEMVRGIAAWQEGRPGDALAMFQRGASIYHELGDVRGTTEMQTNAAGVLGDLGLMHEAIARTAAVVASAERMQLAYLTPVLHMNLCVLRAEVGQFDEARAAGALALALARQQGDPRGEGMTELYLSQGAYLEGRFAAAEAHARAAISTLASIKPTLPAAQAALAQALLCQGKAEDALDQAARAYQALQEQGRVDEGDALIRLVYAECLFESGQSHAGREVIGQAHQRLVDRAETITDPGWRRAFLLQTNSHARTLALARRVSRA